MTGDWRFRDHEQGQALSRALAEEVTLFGHLSLMHVCGTHEQAIAKFGLRTILPVGLKLYMGPGCPVCVTDTREVDEALALAAAGKVIATFGDMLRVPGSRDSLADVRARGGRVEVIYSVTQAVALAERSEQEVVFLATGFETTAVTTAAMVLAGTPPNFSILSAHKYVPTAMEAVAGMPDKEIRGFLAAGHAATVTGWGIFEPLAQSCALPVVVAGFEPLNILAALVKLVRMVRSEEAQAANMYPRCVTREGNTRAMEMLWRVFGLVDGRWRGLGEIARGNLALREEFAHLDARRRFEIDLAGIGHLEPSELQSQCRCGDIMVARATPQECPLFGTTCTPRSPVGACMVSSEGACRIGHTYGRRNIGDV